MKSISELPMCSYCSIERVSSRRAKYCSPSCKQKAHRESALKKSAQDRDEVKSKLDAMLKASEDAAVQPGSKLDKMLQKSSDLSIAQGHAPIKGYTQSEEAKAEMKAKMEKARAGLNESLKRRGLRTLEERAEDMKPKGFLRTGFDELDLLVGNGELDEDNRPVGGFPIERVTELFGRQGVGKTTIMKVVAHRSTVPTLYIDTENALKPEDVPENVDLVTENILENIWGLVNDALDSRAYELIIVDSIAGSSTLSELGMDNETSGFNTGKAKVLNQWMRTITNKIIGSGCAVVFTNQVRDTMDAFSAREYTPGGSALLYYASLRVAFYSPQSKKIVRNGVKVGHRIRAKIMKSRFGPDTVETEFPLMFGEW